MFDYVLKIFRKIYLFFEFLVYYLSNFLRANFLVAYDVLTPKYFMKPGIIKVPVHIKSDVGILLLNNLITMTPGTICLHVADDRSYIYVHDMYIYNRESSVDDIKKMENRIKKLFS